MKKKSPFLSVLRMAGYLTQFGLSVILPPVILVLLGYLLAEKYGIGSWLPIGLLIVGLVSSGCSIYRFYRIFKYETKDEPYSAEVSGCTEAPEVTGNPPKTEYDDPETDAKSGDERNDA